MQRNTSGCKSYRNLSIGWLELATTRRGLLYSINCILNTWSTYIHRIKHKSYMKEIGELNNNFEVAFPVKISERDSPDPVFIFL